MASNSFGTIFKMTTWGESHGKAIGVVIDGCPAGIELNEALINAELNWRKPGVREWTSPRKETDQAEILSGIFEGQTTGTPISIIIWNQDAQTRHYEPIKDLLRPGHANYTYMKKYGCFDYRGGGRASGRETACRVAAGAIAKKMLRDQGILIVAYLKAVGAIQATVTLSDVLGKEEEWQAQVRASALFCPDLSASPKMQEALNQITKEGDSLGGMVEAMAFNVPVGWGDPLYEKLEANLAKAMLSLPASKGFEIGEGWRCVEMRGSEHNDLFYAQGKEIHLATHHAGGTLAGISNGMPLVIRIPFKPPSSLAKNQSTVDFQGNLQKFSLPEGSRHDPCVAIRAVPVVEAMFALVLVDAMLMNRQSLY